MNFEKLKILRDVIANQPEEKTNMANFHGETTCGTCHCVAGWGQLLRISEDRKISLDQLLEHVEFVADNDDITIFGYLPNNCAIFDATKYLELHDNDFLNRLFMPEFLGFDYGAEPGEKDYISRDDVVATLDRMIENETTNVVWIRG